MPAYQGRRYQPGTGCGLRRRGPAPGWPGNGWGSSGWAGSASGSREYGRVFGMTVSAWSQNLDPGQARDAGVEPVSKEQLFSSSDIVTVHYKLSERSTGLIGATELSLMKRSAYLVNTSRGPLVDRARCSRRCGAGRSPGPPWMSTTPSRCRWVIRCERRRTRCSRRTSATSPTTPTGCSSATPWRTSRRLRPVLRSASSPPDDRPETAHTEDTRRRSRAAGPLS